VSATDGYQEATARCYRISGISGNGCRSFLGDEFRSKYFESHGGISKFGS
jgi:hypothetical protein